MRRRTLVDVLVSNLARDPLDAPVLTVADDIDLDDMWRNTPTADEPDRSDYADHGRR